MLRKLLTISYVVSVLTYLSVRNPYFKTIRINSIRALHASKIALTREAGTNDKLSQLLAGLDCYEIPCIQFFDGDDLFRFPDEITKHDVVVITSPQGANVFLNAWKLAGKPKVNIAVVGKGTAKPLQDEGVQPFFQPSDFTGESLAMELPVNHGTKVLYPTSAIAENTVESGLIARGFQVVYDSNQEFQNSKTIYVGNPTEYLHYWTSYVVRSRFITCKINRCCDVRQPISCPNMGGQSGHSSSSCNNWTY